MAKKKHLSDLMRKRDNKAENENPFDIKTNKRRHEVLGQKVMKCEKGKPGVNKSKWMKERMESLLTEHHNTKKDNRIKDKPKTISDIPGLNENAVQKFKVARKNMARLYNLDDDEEGDEDTLQVTHKGRLLSEIEKFEDMEKDSDNDEEEKEFRDKFSEVQFGGPSGNGKRDLPQMIMDSILEKKERNREKHQQALLKESIMKEFEENLPAFKAGLNKPGEEKAVEKTDDLMMKLMMLKTAPRCTPADQVAEPEKDKAKESKMEKERQARMLPQKKTINHRSADDLDDDLYLAPKNKRVRFAEEVNDDEDDDIVDHKPMQNNNGDHDDDDEGDSEGDDDEEGESEGDDDDEEGEDDDEEGDDDEDDGDDDEAAEVGDDDDVEVGVEEEEETDDTEDACVTKFSESLENVLQTSFISREKFCEDIDCLYKISRKNPIGCAQKVLDLIIERHLDFQVKVEKSKSGLAELPKDLKLLFLVHLVGNVYSTSDYQHPVVMPTALLMSQLLTQGAIRSTYDVSYGLLLCSYFLVYVKDSKRFVPEVINFLTSVISLHSSDRHEFYTSNVKDVNMLVLTNKNSSQTPPPFVTIKSTFSEEAPEFLKSEEFKIASLMTAMKLAKTSVEFYSRLPSSVVIYKPMVEALGGIKMDMYPSFVQEKQEELLKLIGSLKHPTSRLVRSDCKPIPLLQYAPKLKEVTKKRNKKEGEKKEELMKYKKMEKGIQRVIRKEQNLKNKIMFDEMVHVKNMRKEKTKKIINELATQEGEYNAMRKNKGGKKQKVKKF